MHKLLKSFFTQFLDEKRITIIFFIFALLFLLVKSYIISLPNQISFLNYYSYFSADSFDWLINGLFLFRSTAISFRNPGLPLLIKILNNYEALQLLPYINNLFFFQLIIAIFFIIKKSTKNIWIALITGTLLLFNYSLNYYANLILADIYAISFISVALWSFLGKKPYLTMFFLGCSALFQNFAFFIAPFFLIYNFLTTGFSWTTFRKNIYYGLTFMILPGSWFIYKFILFGNPFYTQVMQFGLLKFSLDNFIYYFINSYTFFGLVFLLALIFLTLFFRKKIKSSPQKHFLIFLLIFSWSFWTFFYHWADRRFLLYSLPYIFIFFAYFCQYFWHHRYKVFMICVIIACLVVNSFYCGDGINGYSLPLGLFSINFDRTLDPDGFSNYHLYPKDLLKTKLGAKNQTNFSVIWNLPSLLKKGKKEQNSTFQVYSNYIRHHSKEDICKNSQNFDSYIYRSIIFINKGKSFSELCTYQ